MLNFYILIGVLALVVYLTSKGRNNNYFISENNSNMSVGFSYGATLVSTSAIVGFGGLAGWLGYSVFTLLFALSLSTFFAIRYIGPRIYRLNQKHKARTYIELLSKHYQSPTLGKILAGATVILVPFYSAAVLIGISKFITAMTDLPYLVSLTLFSVIIGFSVFVGGMKGVLQNDLWMGRFMIIGSILIALHTLYSHVGPDYLLNLRLAWEAGTDGLTNFAKSIGFTGYTEYPDFWSKGWLYIVTLLVFTIPIGSVALPQLQTRFMLAKDEKSFQEISWYGLVVPFLIIACFFFAGVTANSNAWLIASTNAVTWSGDIGKIIPTWIATGYPEWLSTILFITVTAAAISTVNSLMHLLVSTVEIDLGYKYRMPSIIGVILFAVGIAFFFEKEPAFISRSTALYFSILGGSILPSLVGLLRGHTDKIVAVWSVSSGMVASLVWILFFHFKESKLFTGITIDIGRYNFVDTVFPALLISLLVYYVCHTQRKSAVSG